LHFTVEGNEENYGEYFGYDGTITIHLAEHITIWGLFDTINHELIHQAIEENCDHDTTEKQDHYIIQRLCF